MLKNGVILLRFCTKKLYNVNMKTHLLDSIERKHYVIKKADALEYKIQTIYSGTYQCKENEPNGGHKHNFLEIMLVTNGNGHIRIEDHDFAVKKDNIIIYYPGKKHCEWVDNNDVFNAIFFAIKINKQIKELLKKNILPFVLSTKNNYSFFYKNIVELIKQCQESDIIYQDKIVNGFAKIIFLKILQISPNHYLENNTNKLILDVKNYIDSHFTESINILSLNKELFVSEYYVSRLFKEYIGVTPSHYIIEKRIDLAKQLLESTELSTLEISQKVGYNDVYHFMKLFKKEVGVRPSLYRKQIKEIYKYQG